MDEAPGWDAIEGARASAHPGVEPYHVAVGNGLAFGSPLQGISAYGLSDHWHLITYGLTELWAKEGDDARLSGWGYELTMRVRRDPGGGLPPDWAFNLLVGIAKVTWERSVVFGEGHRLQPRGLITGSRDSQLTALAFTQDPEVGSIATPNGSVAFLQVVGITEEELARMKATSTAEVLARLAMENPLLVTDPARSST